MRFRCYLCPDRRPGRRGHYHEFESDKPICDKCGQQARIVELTDVHYLLPDDNGPIWDASGSRWKIGCEPKRDALALDVQDTYAASHEPAAVTCPSCKGLPQFKEALKAFLEKHKHMRGAFKIEEGGCCPPADKHDDKHE